MVPVYNNMASVQTVTSKYEKFKGADFTSDPSQIDASRSPWPLNLIADEGGFPEKRLGWRTVLTLTGQINGIYTLTVDESVYWILHHGGTISQVNIESGAVVATLKSGINNARSQGFVFDEKLYLLTGAEYLVVSVASGAITCKEVTENAYIPRTFIARHPSGGGTALEGINLLSAKRQNDFLADGTSTVYQLDATDIDSVDWIEVNGTVMTTGYTANLVSGTVTFTAAPKKPENAGGIEGADNVLIRYSKHVDGYAERVTKCTVLAQFGQGAFDRVFISGNPGFPNLDWYSGYRDPTYFSDLSYSVIGSEQTAVMGYLHIGEQLAVIKEDNQQDATVFIRSVEISSDGTVKFPLKQGVQSIGAVSKYCFQSLRDDPLFLSAYGVNALVTNNILLERTIKRRSGLIDPKLTAESGLSEAVASVWGDWYVICINGNCYVADSKQQSYKGSVADNFMYEWYFWNNVPARVLFEREGTLWFGTADGRLCRFNTDRNGMNRFSDDGAAIIAEWATKSDDDGDFMRFKTMIRRGSGVMCKPYTISSVKVIIKTDRDFGTEIKNTPTSIFDFNYLDFSALSFNTSEGPQVVPFNRKVRKYKTIQIIVRNDGVNQGFGVYGIIKRFRVMGYVK